MGRCVSGTCLATLAAARRGASHASDGLTGWFEKWKRGRRYSFKYYLRFTIQIPPMYRARRHSVRALETKRLKYISSRYIRAKTHKNQ